ncbi:MAG: hypothetical protein ACRDE2_06925 [Chitinophagaceae bacterium]
MMCIKKWLVLAVGIFPWIACNNHTGGKTFNTNVGKDSSITFDLSPDSATRIASVIPDTIILKMDSTGKISWSDRLIKLTDLQQQVQDSLLEIYIKSGRLPSRLDIRYYGTVMMGIRGDADDMIRQAQIVLRNVISVKTLNKPYISLDSAMQNQFQKQYPVLFQNYY